MKRTCLALLLTGCPTDAGDSDSQADVGSTDTDATPDVSYAQCDDPQLGCADEDCRERTANGAQWLVCVPPCTQSADCPIAVGGNTSPECDDAGRCVLSCTPGVAVCPTGTTCVEGDPAQCMWPVDPGVANLDELCTAACDGCNAGPLLGWPGECAVECAADLADCTPDEITAALLCPGDLACSVGGLAVNSCLDELACKD
ncbi:MAG: hypothetical protein JKY37_17325 [Nannocystaceae bacterium]|nr:hypothetical protein [Nannocystaceae bacterium]